MIPYITLGVTLLSLVATLFLLWVLAGAKTKEEPTDVIGFRYMPTQEPSDDE